MTAWQPCCDLETLKLRAHWQKKIRDFFYTQQLLEVNTPALSRYSVSEAGLSPFVTDSNTPLKAPLYLQTSPEYAMKRLLAAGSGSLYQLGHCFRNHELGKHHNPEFLMIEWYRTEGADAGSLQDLIKDIQALLSSLIDTQTLTSLPYQTLFFECFSTDPHQISLDTLQRLGQQHLSLNDSKLTPSDWLELLFEVAITHYYEHLNCSLEQAPPIIVTEYPYILAQLAKSGPAFESNTDQTVAYRIELYWRGIEIANGYQELTDPEELQARWQSQQTYPDPSGVGWQHRQDPRLLAAMQAGLPECSGCALGFDRLLAAYLEVDHIAKAMPFSLMNA